MRQMTLICAALASFAASPSLGWEFSPVPICTIRSTVGPQVEVTYDASVPEYAIHITAPEGWRPAPIFSIRFEGVPGAAGRGGMISTDRHVISGDTLTVRDVGFGNVLGGMQFNARAVAILGDQEVVIDLTGAAEPVESFRGCPADLSV